MPYNSMEWTDPVREDIPKNTGVYIWRLRLTNLGGAPLQVLRPLTVPAEHVRARRYRYDADRHRHLAGRALVRAFVARRYDCPPQAVSIGEGPHGKPYLKEPQDDDSSLEFNIAHTDEVVVAAFSQTHPVGIDIEPLDRDADTEALADRVFTEAEQRHWRALPKPDRSRAFLRVWTCKEAFLKAVGAGLHRAPKTVECLFDDNMVVGLTDANDYRPSPPTTSADRWVLHSFSATDGIDGAIVRRHSFPSSPVFADAERLIHQLSTL